MNPLTIVAATGRGRLDCGADNVPLRAFCANLGFEHVDDVEIAVPGAGSGASPWRAGRYQRAVPGIADTEVGLHGS